MREHPLTFLRKALGPPPWTRTRLAAEIGVGLDEVSRAELGRRRMSRRLVLRTWERFAKPLTRGGYTMADLLSWEVEPQP